MATGHIDHLVNLFSKRFGQLDDLVQKILHLEASKNLNVSVTKRDADSVKEAKGDKSLLLGGVHLLWGDQC